MESKINLLNNFYGVKPLSVENDEKTKKKEQAKKKKRLSDWLSNYATTKTTTSNS